MVNLSHSIRVLLVDDEAIIRYGLKMIAEADPSLEVVGEAGDGKAAIAQAERLKPDIVLMDINMPILDGVAATEEIRRRLPEIKVLILTTHDDDEYLFAAVDKGAAGYLLKNTPPEDFIHIIQATHKGYMQFCPGVAQKLYQRFKPPASPEKTVAIEDITPREQEVLSLIAEGANNKEIARTLQITEKTVKNHVSNILSRVGLRDRTQLAIWANSLTPNSSPAILI